MAALALAAALPLALHARSVNIATEERITQSAAVSHLDLDQLIEQFVAWHARPLPPEITRASDLLAFEPYVGVPVRPPTLTPFGAELLGGRILPVHEQRVTAMLQYTMATGHRISVYVYDPHRIRLNPSRLRERVMGSEPVYVGHVRGYSVAAAQRRGVGYAVASDLDDEESVELALAADPDNRDR